MKKIISLSIIQLLFVLSICSQQVSDYSYKLDNGINVKTEHCWNQVWVQQSFAPMDKNDKSAPLTVNIRALGDLISGSEFKLFKSNKEVKMQDATPGKYDLQLSFNLSGKPGKLRFTVGNIELKPATRTTLSVTLYDYQVTLEEKQAPLNGLAQYESDVNRCKSHTVQENYYGIPTFYEKGDHSKAINPDKKISNVKGTIKPGTYDLLVTINIANQTQKVWLENFQLKPDISYKLAINLNAGGIVYTGGNPDVKGMLMYPAGTASRQQGTPAPIQNIDAPSYNNVTIANCCSPGIYDVLLKFSKASKYEWRKNITISTGTRTEVK
jgi:hypothetical protein